MLALYIETLLLMVGAYVLGAALACLVRRSITAPARPIPVPAPERRVDPLPELARMADDARFDRGADVQPEPAQGVVSPAASASPERGPAEDLQRISGIAADTKTALNRLGVRRYDEIAALTPKEVRRIDDALGLKGRISRENWIEQAAILARGEETYFAKRRARGETANASPTQDEGEPHPAAAGAAPPAGAEQRGSLRTAPGIGVANTPASPPPPATSGAATEPDVSGRAAFAEAAAAPAADAIAPAAAIAAATHDNLLRIVGITEEFAARLAAQGVLRYSQIAQWSAADVRRIEEQLGIEGTIARQNWIEQAQILSRGGDTAFSREFDRRTQAAAPRESTSVAIASPQAARAAPAALGSLRSVRAEAYRNPEPGPEAALRAAAQDKVLRSARPDDLKRIRGIGVLTEKKLNAMGILGYEQIANWTAEDIDRVSQSLDFKGRIERENWIEQARILASGGVTEYARRVDRGEVESSRYRG
jgi:predicted flap endonuclease-1-like 5' DNA nuclease